MFSSTALKSNKGNLKIILITIEISIMK